MVNLSKPLNFILILHVILLISDINIRILMKTYLTKGCLPSFPFAPGTLFFCHIAYLNSVLMREVL